MKEDIIATFEDTTLVLSKNGRAIIKNLDLTVSQGDFIVLLGGNGSGKSSCIKMLNGTFKPTQGKIVVDGRDAKTMTIKDISRFVGTLTQDVEMSTFGDMTVFENCFLADTKGTEPVPYKKTALYEKYRKYLKTFLPRFCDMMEMPAKKLSGGEKQLLGLAMCLMHPPKLLLLDEHTSALDHTMAENVMAITTEIIRQKNITTIMVTHHIQHAIDYGNRILGMKEGRVVCDMREENKSSLTKDDILKMCY
ncbi:MAG: ATP-binding cassette domain-containing protein [Waddliaceae bacterium]|jgi:putative tryptophan/tyrosine transport system ATP-binding protein|nr:ATP-binding cassette domain-containing protein [Waddliaceae bacterium]MBT3578630.1 ATP-binding cassette domain-containing protein [Waddliaceae bacterium]MBT4445349.1 ATP-binding cassette domain-containing protein [Waddliaceae bacterium]MBT6928383.1 ATP-binding cassette domain-containing protein [Waddliaceae bacterium]MBT7461694.1 ATP-binding cassette domain-containing protein [Waddliaceae bacterium]